MDIFLDFGEEYPTRSVGDLRREFLKFHTLRRREIDRSRKIIQRVMNPVALKLNPPQYFNEIEDKWFAVYHRKFFVTITEGKTMFGPHIAQLFIQVYPGYSVWLGTAQMKCNFYSRKEIRKKLRLAISKEKYFVSESSAEEIVEFHPPKDEDKFTAKI